MKIRTAGDPSDEFIKKSKKFFKKIINEYDVRQTNMIGYEVGHTNFVVSKNRLNLYYRFCLMLKNLSYSYTPSFFEFLGFENSTHSTGESDGIGLSGYLIAFDERDKIYFLVYTCEEESNNADFDEHFLETEDYLPFVKKESSDLVI